MGKSRKKNPPILTRFWASVLAVFCFTLVMHLTSFVLYPRRAAFVLVMLTVTNIVLLLISVWRRDVPS